MKSQDKNFQVNFRRAISVFASDNNCISHFTLDLDLISQSFHDNKKAIFLPRYSRGISGGELPRSISVVGVDKKHEAHAASHSRSAYDCIFIFTQTKRNDDDIVRIRPCVLESDSSRHTSGSWNFSLLPVCGIHTAVPGLQSERQNHDGIRGWKTRFLVYSGNVYALL